MFPSVTLTQFLTLTIHQVCSLNAILNLCTNSLFDLRVCHLSCINSQFIISADKLPGMQHVNYSFSTIYCLNDHAPQINSEIMDYERISYTLQAVSYAIVSYEYRCLITPKYKNFNYVTNVEPALNVHYTAVCKAVSTF